MSKREICWDTVFFNVREASQELDELFMALEAKRRGEEKQYCGRVLTEGIMAVALAHAYHHLNSAWRARMRPMPEADRTFSANEKWPVGFSFDRFWTRRQCGGRLNKGTRRSSDE